MAIATSPKIIIADEPTTGLDVSIAARVLDLLRDLGSRTGAAIILITHDLGVVAETCHRVAVMHAGAIGRNGAEHGTLPQSGPPIYQGLNACDPTHRRRSKAGADFRIGSLTSPASCGVSVSKPLSRKDGCLRPQSFRVCSCSRAHRIVLCR